MSPAHVRILVLSAALTLCCGVQGAVSYNATFDSNIPSAIKCENLDGGTLQANAYRKKVDAQTSWYWERPELGNGAALCPTRNQDGLPRRSRMTFPTVTIADAEAVLRWDARRMLKQCPESYRVLLRTADSEEWKELCCINDETHTWTTHHLSLADYAEQDVQIAFETSSAGNAYMLAIDDVSIGTLRDSKYRFTPTTHRHYYTPDEEVTIGGDIVNYGSELRLQRVELVDGEGELLMGADIPAVAPFKTFSPKLTRRLKLGETLDYKVVAIDDDGERITLYDDYVCCSHFPRTLLMDRFTGTWCNNCPQMSITVAREQQRYADELIVAEVHVSNGAVDEPMFCPDYWNGYGSECVFSIPQLLVNHNYGTASDKKDYYATLDAELRSETIAHITATATHNEAGDVLLTANCLFAYDTDNHADRFRVGYLLLTDVHEPDLPEYYQKNSAQNPTWEEYYCLPNTIMPDMAYFDNVVIEASTGISGIAGHLPDQLQAFTPVVSQYTLQVPDAYKHHPLRAVALLIDTQDGRILNCHYAQWDSADAISAPAASRSHSTATYDLTGRKITTTLARGIYIRNGRKIGIR